MAEEWSGGDEIVDPVEWHEGEGKLHVNALLPTKAGEQGLLIRYRGPAGLRAAGKSGVKRWAKNHTHKDPSALVDAIFEALAEQAVTVPGTEASESVVPRHASRIKALKAQRKEIEAEAEELADSLPLFQVSQRPCRESAFKPHPRSSWQPVTSTLLGLLAIWQRMRVLPP